jgi:hypothetical protein
MKIAFLLLALSGCVSIGAHNARIEERDQMLSDCQQNWLWEMRRNEARTEN